MLREFCIFQPRQLENLHSSLPIIERKNPSSWPRYCKLQWPAAPGTDIFIWKMVGEPLGMGPLNNQPHVHLILRGYIWGISPFKELFGGGLKQLGYLHAKGTTIFPMISLVNIHQQFQSISLK